jgi:F-type H+-transporting ATPase subunit delta
MKGTRAASRYAKSLLELSIEQNALDPVRNDMAYMGSVISENQDLQLMLKSPIVKSDKKITVLKSIFDAFDDLSKAFIDLIGTNGREDLLPHIATSFDKLYKAHKGIVDVEITSAKVLDETTKTAILEKVGAAYKGDFVVNEKIDESLIGGFLVTVGDHQIDATVSRKFRDLRQVLMN